MLKWKPTPVFLPRKFHQKGSLAGYTVHGVAMSCMLTFKHHIFILLWILFKNKPPFHLCCR